MKVTKTNEHENHHIFGLIVGASGVGKTSLVKTLPEEKTLIISAESGLLSVKDCSIDVITLKEFDDMYSILKFLKTPEAIEKYDHVFIDSLTEIAESLFASLKPKDGKGNLFEIYDKYSTKITGMLKVLRDTANYNIWLTCLDKMVAKDFTEVVSLDLIQKSLSKKVPALFDEVFYMTTIEHDSEVKRVLIADNTIADFSKDRSGKLNKISLPDLSLITKTIFQ